MKIFGGLAKIVSKKSSVEIMSLKAVSARCKAVVIVRGKHRWHYNLWTFTILMTTTNSAAISWASLRLLVPSPRQTKTNARLWNNSILAHQMDLQFVEALPLLLLPQPDCRTANYQDKGTELWNKCQIFMNGALRLTHKNSPITHYCTRRVPQNRRYTFYTPLPYVVVNSQK